MFSIVCVTWKSSDNAQELACSIRDKSYYKTHQGVVVHNEGDTCVSIDGWENDFQPANLGLSKAANHGAKYATKDYICLIDDDMTVLDNWDIGLFKAYEITKSNWVSSTCIEPVAPHYNISEKEFRSQCYDKYRFGWYRNISNTPLLIPRKFWKEIGGYDEDFLNSGAELGLAKRAYDHGERQFVQTPYSLVMHKQSQSFKRSKGLKGARIDRDKIFLGKYGITRKEFTKIIGKGEAYEMYSKIGVV